MEKNKRIAIGTITGLMSHFLNDEFVFTISRGLNDNQTYQKKFEQLDEKERKMLKGELLYNVDKLFKD